MATSGSDDQTNVQQAFVAEFSVTVSGGSSPTADASIETSWDKGTTWHEVAKMTQLAGAGSKKQLVDIDKLSQYALAQYQRFAAAAGLGGDTLDPVEFDAE